LARSAFLETVLLEAFLSAAESDLDDIAQIMGVGEAIRTMREVVSVLNRPLDIEEAIAFFSGEKGDADQRLGRHA
jgi:ABC-type maltose transport system permease subunit